jgi:hypothetical protein
VTEIALARCGHKGRRHTVKVRRVRRMSTSPTSVGPEGSTEHLDETVEMAWSGHGEQDIGSVPHHLTMVCQCAI